MNFDLFYTGILQGLILALITFGLMIPFRFLNFPDLTAEGAYPLGGAICANLMVSGYASYTALCCSMLAGGILAICTAQVSMRLKINGLLAGITLSTMAYSVNLRIMGKPNIAIFEQSLDLNMLSLISVNILAIATFALFLKTDYGLRLRTVGQNIKFAQGIGISISSYTCLGLFLAGTLFSLAGCLMVQMQQFMDVGMGVGIVIHALASLMLGEALMGNQSLSRQLVSPLIGALLYQQIQGLVLAAGLAPSDLKFFTGCTVLLIIAMQKGVCYEK